MSVAVLMDSCNKFSFLTGDHVLRKLTTKSGSQMVEYLGVLGICLAMPLINNVVSSCFPSDLFSIFMNVFRAAFAVDILE